MISHQADSIAGETMDLDPGNGPSSDSMFTGRTNGGDPPLAMAWANPPDSLRPHAQILR